MEGDAGPLTGPVAQRQRLATLAFLSTSPRGVSREKVLATLWPDVEPERARRSLSNVLYAIRRALGDEAVVGAGDELRLNRGTLAVDTHEFEAALGKGELERAVELYGGPFLDGFSINSVEFEQWADGELNRLAAMYGEALETLAEEATTDGRVRDAVAWWRRAAAHDRHNTRVAVALMKALEAASDTAGALRHARIYGALIENELGTKPDPVVNDLATEIKRRADSAASAGATHETTSPSNRIPPAPAAPGEDVGPPPQDGPLPWWKNRIVIATALALAAAAVVWVANTGLDRRRVAVAAFENQTDDPTLDRLGRIAADWITRGLQEMDLIEAVPPEATFSAYRTLAAASGESGWVVTVEELAKATGAGTVISGAFYLLGDSLQFQARVIDARRQRLLLAVEPVAGPRDEPMKIVESLRGEVMSVLASVFDPHLARYVSATVPPPTFDAYQEFMEAEELFERGMGTGQARYYEDALRSYYRAMELDSTFSMAMVRAAIAHGNLGQLAVAESLAHMADKRRARLTSLGQNQLDFALARWRGNRAEALRVARRLPSADRAAQALSNNRPRETLEALKGFGPFSPWYWNGLTSAHHMLGEHKRELRVARRARKKEERYPIIAMMYEVRALAALGRISELVGRLDQSLSLPSQQNWPPGRVMAVAAAELRAHGYRQASLEVAERASAWYQTRAAQDRAEANSPHRFRQAVAYYLNEQWDAAQALFQELASEFPGNINYQGYLGVLAARRGDHNGARQISDRLEGLANPYDFGRDTYWQACIAALLGERDHAMVLLRDAYEQGRPFTLGLHTDIDLEPLHGYPPFQDFLRPKG